MATTGGNDAARPATEPAARAARRPPRGPTGGSRARGRGRQGERKAESNRATQIGGHMRAVERNAESDIEGIDQLRFDRLAS